MTTKRLLYKSWLMIALIGMAVHFPASAQVRSAITKKKYDAVVSNTNELTAAIRAANSRANKSVRYRIFIKNGNYKFPRNTATTITSDDGNKYPSPITLISASNISFIGESMEGVIITNDIPADATYQGKFGITSVYDGISKSDVLQIQNSVSNTYFQDLTVRNSMPDSRGRNLAIQDRGTQTIYKNTCLWGFQDTWTSNKDRGLFYFENGLVRGRTDFLCGKGDAYFNQVTIQVCMNTGGYIAVPSKSVKYGFVFKDCTIKGESKSLNGNYTLGRPWGKGTPIALWIDTKMEIVPTTLGWSEMSDGWPKRFAEYNSMTANGTPVDLSKRKTVFGDGHPNNPRLTAEEAAEASDMSNMFGSWNPKAATEQAPAPTHVTLSGSTLSWEDSDLVLLWAIVKDGAVIDFTTTPSYTVDDPDARYMVRAANEMGGLGEATEATVIDGIRSLSIPSKVSESTYNLQGIRVSHPRQGVFIVNGRKVVVK